MWKVDITDFSALNLMLVLLFGLSNVYAQFLAQMSLALI